MNCSTLARSARCCPASGSLRDSTNPPGKFKTDKRPQIADSASALQREHDLPDPRATLDDLVCTAGFVQRKNLADQHFQLPFGSNLERQSEIVRRVDRVAEDRDHVEVQIFHVE